MKWKHWLMSLVWLSTISWAAAQSPASDTLQQDEENEMILEAIDSLTSLLMNANAFTLDTTQYADIDPDSIPVFEDSVYAYRLSLLPSPIDLTYNETVRRYIDMYLVHRRSQVQKMVGLSHLYFPIFEEVLDKYELPLELKYLPVIESALNPHAVSRVGATGLWQFMYPTARLYGLSINSYLDERRDPHLAADAAARFLKDLHDLYGNWSMALAAYNCGPGNVNKAIRRSGGKTTYWEIRPYLPRETRGYVPAFIAATYVMNYYEDHNIVPMMPDFDLVSTDTLMIHQQLPLKMISDYIDLSEEELSFFNPALRRNVIPFTKEGYALKLPFEKIAAFDTYRDSIYLAAADKPEAPANSTPQFTSAKSYAAKNAAKNRSNYYSNYTPNTEGKTKLVYTIKSGDNLGFIAEWYDVSIRDLKLWNNIRGSRIYAGQQLKVYVPDEEVDQYRNIDKLSPAQKQSIAAQKQETTAAAQSTTSRSQVDKNKQIIHYTIKKGDTLWDLTKKYPKNTVEDLKRMNNITDVGVLKPGYILKVAI